MKQLFVVTILAALATTGLQGPATAQGPTKLTVKVLNGQRVYHHRSLRNAKPGTTIQRVSPVLVDSRSVFNATPQYQEIQREGIKKGSARYDILIRQASTLFKNAIKRTLSTGGYDLIAEKGAVTVAGTRLPDVTQEVVDNLL